MGTPTEIKDCDRARYSGNPELWHKCAEEYWYVAFMQSWGVVIAKDGTLLDTIVRYEEFFRRYIGEN